MYAASLAAGKTIDLHGTVNMNVCLLYRTGASDRNPLFPSSRGSVLLSRKDISRVRDGNSFATRSVAARQKGEWLLCSIGKTIVLVR